MFKPWKNALYIALAALCICMCGAGRAFAQTITGSITGTVTDPSGAVVKGAKVTVTNVDTGVTVSDTSNGAGIYNLRFLPIGRYRGVTEVNGFSKQTFGPFNLEIDQTAKVDVSLKVGSDSTQVDVAGGAVPLLDTEDSTIATTLTANTIENVPLSGRNWSTLTLFTPGAIATNPSSFNANGNTGNVLERNQFGGGNAQANVNGNRAEGNNYRLDGIEINETLNNLVGYNPNPDAVAQIQVISANAPAQYGNVNGGDILAVTKSGTNAFHGSAGIFLQDYKLDANTWSNKHFPPGTAFTARNPYTQTQFSGTIGGPIIKDKLFFFADYFGTRYHSGGQATASVLTTKMRTGDFSELLNPAIMCSSTGGTCVAGTNAVIQLYDPTNAYKAYANNQITVTNPVFSYLAASQYYPLPNIAPAVNSAIQNNYRGNVQNQVYNNQGDIRIDYTPSARNHFFGRWLQGESGDHSVGALALTFPSASIYPDKGLALGYTRTISNSLVNDFRAGYTRIRWNQGAPADTTGAFGLSGDKIIGIPATQSYAGFAAQNFTASASSNNISNLGNLGGGTNFIDNTFVYSDDLSWQKGKHLFDFGTVITRYQQNNFYPGSDGGNGQFNFSGAYTSNPNIASGGVSSGAGFSAADWALNRTYFSGIGAVAGRTGQRQYRSGYYVQDDWKIRPNLVLNLGVRYEYFQPIYEVNNKTANVNYQTQQVEYAGSVPVGAPAGSVVCPTRSCLNAQYNNFMPRVGFSYQAMPRLVIRGGFGITKAMEGTGANLRLTYNAPFANSLEFQGTNPTTSTPGNFVAETAGFTAPTGAVNAGGFYRTEDPNIKPQETNEYSLTTEYQLNNFSSFKIGYVGELSQHLIQAVTGNQLYTPCVINGAVVDPTMAQNTATCTTVDPAPLVKLVGENGFVFETASRGMANYNALQAQYRQRTHKGLEFTVNYAYAHAMTNSTGFFGVAGVNGQSPYAQNAYNNHAEYGNAASDVRHSLNGTAVYALPFGIGKEYASHVNHLVDEVIGGWKASMTALVYSGLPVTITGNDEALTNNNAGAGRAYQLNNLHVTSHSINNWFGGLTGVVGNQTVDLKYSATGPAGTYGTAAVGTERAPGFQQYDASLFKDFHIYHDHSLNFRVDAYNILNLTSLGNPDSGAGDTTFGAITSVKSVPRQLNLSAKYQF